MLLTIGDLNKGNEENRKRLKVEYEELNRKLERTEERYMNEEIAQDLFLKYSEKYKLEKLDLLRKTKELEANCSNHEEIIDLVLDFSENLNKMWHSGDFIKRQRLQYFLFPKGLSYEKKTDQVRTTEYNYVILTNACKQQTLGNKKSGIPSLQLDYPTLVVL